MTRQGGEVDGRRRAQMQMLLDARQREKIVDEPRHAPRLIAHDRQKALARGGIVARGALQRFDETEKRGERRPQFVAGVGDEVDAHAFEPARFAEIAQRQYEQARLGYVRRGAMYFEHAFDRHALDPRRALRPAAGTHPRHEVENVGRPQAACEKIFRAQLRKQAARGLVHGDHAVVIVNSEHGIGKRADQALQQRLVFQAGRCVHRCSNSPPSHPMGRLVELSLETPEPVCQGGMVAVPNRAEAQVSKHDHAAVDSATFDIRAEDLPHGIAKRAFESGGFPYRDKLDREAYETDLRRLQIELVRMLDWVKKTGERVVILFEGRDAAGKGGTIQRLTEHLNPRSVRVVALPRPSEAEVGQWYFQRYASHLPPAGEIVIFDRSWYNRAGVERVFDFCTPQQTSEFLHDAPVFEAMLTRSGIRLIKFFLSIGLEMQMSRLNARWNDPLHRWKLSDIDFQAIAKWDAYTAAFEAMLGQTDSAAAPWTVLRANDKRRLRLEAIRHVLDVLPYADKDAAAIGRPDGRIALSAAGFLGVGGHGPRGWRTASRRP